MKAAVTLRQGNPEVIEIQNRPIPTIKEGWVLIKVKAFGLNRSELFTRQGHSPNVVFPRIQGIECVGLVEKDPSGKLEKGQQVAAIMGGMGREFDGGYAEYVLVPEDIIFSFTSSLPWDILGAIPEMFQTVAGSLQEALEIDKNETLLIRGGTSSIGMLSCQLAKYLGVTVIATTRNESKRQHLLDNGVDHVIIDNGSIKHEVKKLFPKGVHKVLELIGTRTLKDSLQCIQAKGMVCMTGILGNEWTMKEFTPMGDIPSMGRLTVYMGEANNMDHSRLQEFISLVEKDTIKLHIDRVFNLEEITTAHNYMEQNLAKGKLVVLISDSTT